jgi:hypothetical protein
VGPFNELNCCTIVDYLNIWIDPIEALAGIDEKSVRKTSTGCLSIARSVECVAGDTQDNTLGLPLSQRRHRDRSRYPFLYKSFLERLMFAHSGHSAPTLADQKFLVDQRGGEQYFICAQWAFSDTVATASFWESSAVIDMPLSTPPILHWTPPSTPPSHRKWGPLLAYNEIYGINTVVPCI